MGVVTVIGEEGVQVLVEFVGGPRDGKRSFAVASTDIEGRPIPPSGFVADQFSEGAGTDGTAPGEAGDRPNEIDLGRYVREGLTPEGEAYSYVWRTAPVPSREVPFRDPPPPDLATIIRRDYARRVTAEDESAKAPKRRPKSRSGTSKRG
jgi:hypothetical protein